MKNHAFVVPFRDRGGDPHRAANLAHIRKYLRHLNLGPVYVVDDGRDGQFCRHAAYNKGAKQAGADVVTFYESDMIVFYQQLVDAIKLAADAPGLVVPFTEYRYLTQVDSERVRLHQTTPLECVPESVMDNGASIGAVNTISKTSMKLVGQWDETFQGSWFDDRAMCRAFEVCCGPTRYIDGPAYHLYHLPGWKGEHLTDEDRVATARNKRRLKLYRRATTAERVRQLTAGGT